MELHNNTHSDIYIWGTFSEADRIVNTLKKYNIFRLVKLINPDETCQIPKCNNTFEVHINTIKQYMDVDRIIKPIIENDIDYRAIFFTCNHICFRLFRFYFIKHKSKTKFTLFDEGVGSYDGHFEKIKIPDLIVRYLLFGRKSTTMKYDIHLYKPELYYDYRNQQRTIYQIAPFDEVDEKFKDSYFNIFGSDVHAIPPKCIYFDAVREEICETSNAAEKMQHWFDAIEASIGPANISIKSHPRAKDKYPHKCPNYPNTSCPMEIDYLNMDLDNTILISVASTAVITPKLLYDKEPIVLLLCNVDTNVYTPNEKQLELYHNIQSEYKDKRKFMMPDNMAELRQCLDTISNKLI